MNIDDPAPKQERARYREELEYLIALALSGQMTRRELAASIEVAANKHEMTMFLLGGGNPERPGAKRYFERQRKINRNSARKLAADVFAGRYSDDEPA